MRRTSTLLLTALLGTACQPSDDTGTTASGTSETETETGHDGDNSITEAEPEPEPEPDPEPTTAGDPTGSGTAEDTESPTTDGDADTSDDGFCGDGIVQEGEGCDDGVFDPNGPCLPGCNANVCGDGHVYAGVEDCDAGQQNGAYGGSCSETCTGTGIPGCGDGILQEEYEACEEGQTNGDGLLCNECQFDDFRYIFLSSVKVNGAMETNLSVPDSATGIYRADAICNVLAYAAELPGTYYAWLSDNNNHDESDAADRIKAAGSSAVYVMPGVGKVADSWDDLISNGPSEPIVWTEKSDEVAPVRVWTNTNHLGQSLGEVACENWTNADGTGWTATTTEGLDWTSLAAALCLYEFHLYCVQGAQQ